MLRLTENNSQPLMTKLQWLFAFLEHSQVSAGGLVRDGEEAPGLPPSLLLGRRPCFLVYAGESHIGAGVGSWSVWCLMGQERECFLVPPSVC